MPFLEKIRSRWLFVAEERSRTGSIVVIYTHLGEMTVDGEAFSFKEAIAGAFSRAGFTIDEAAPAQARRLLGIVQLIGIFNKINQASTNSTLPQGFFPVAPLPNTFVARVEEIIKCSGQDCLFQGELVDWATLLPDGSPALIQYEDLFSLTLNGSPVAKSMITKSQWPEQSITKLQNLTHALSFQTYNGFNYHCAMTNDTSLADSVKRRRRRAAVSGPLKFLGFVNLDGVYCRRFQIINSSLEIFEDYHSNRIYQLQPSPLHVWRFSSLTAVAKETENPLAAADLDLDAVLKDCDPQGRIPPPRLIEGTITNTQLIESDWGTLINTNISQPSPDLLKLNLSEAAALFNLSARNFSAGMPTLQSVSNAQQYNRMRDFWQVPSKEIFDALHREKWTNVSDPEEYNTKIREHQQRYLRDLDLGADTGCLGVKTEIPFPMTRIAFLEGGSLLNIEIGLWYQCNGDQAYLQGGVIALEAHIAVSPNSPSGYKCPSKSGDIQVYIPTRGDREVILFGSIRFEFGLRDCLSGIIPRFVLKIASYILDATLGLQLQFGVNSLTEKPCPNLKCVGYVTSDKGGCWLKKEGAFYQWPQARRGKHSYILTKNGFSYNQMLATDSPHYDIYYSERIPSSSCWFLCTYSLPAWCGGYMINSASLTTGVGKCWLKTAATFQQGNMRPLSWVHSYVKADSDAETYRPIENYDSRGSDLQYVALPSSACQSACDEFNARTSMLGKLGNFPRALIGVGKGYGNIRFLNMGAEMDLSLNIFYGLKCATGQRVPQDSAYMGIGVDFGVKAYIDFWLWEASTNWRTNILPPSQDPCQMAPFSNSYFADDQKGYYIFKTQNECV